MTIAVTDFFRVDPNVARTLARRDWSRGEILTMLGLYAYAQWAPRSHRIFGAGDCADPTLEVPFFRHQLLELLGFERTRERPRAPRDFSSNSWRLVKRALARLQDAPATFEFTTKSRSRTDRHTFCGSMVAVYGDSILVRCCVPEKGRYFVLVPTALLRLPLSANGLRLAVWLVVLHRGGKSKKHGFRHRWAVNVTPAELVQAGVMPKRGARRSLRAALEELVRSAVVTVESMGPQAVSLALARNFFHED